MALPAARVSPRVVTTAARGVHVVRTGISNVVLVASDADDGRWVLVDAGMPRHAERIVRAAEAIFGDGTRPQAIVLTHGHFDHVGSLDALLAHWDVPVFAHPIELPHLTGRLDYPPADPLVGGGMMAWSARLYPRRAIDLGPRLLALPPDGSVPGVTGWQWVHTPGHTAGHVSLFRPEGRVLVAGDAVVTTKQESALAVLSGWRVVHGPPAYFTIDWDEARESVRALAELDPRVIAAGHGRPMGGVELERGLRRLAVDFDRVARPWFGRYVQQPAVARAGGDFALPPDPLPRVLGRALGAAVAGYAVSRALRARRPSQWPPPTHRTAAAEFPETGTR
jgi:glyoxylase-like metal-dependent hydrolase (beta-lactamase superfamily II)